MQQVVQKERAVRSDRVRQVRAAHFHVVVPVCWVVEAVAVRRHGYIRLRGHQETARCRSPKLLLQRRAHAGAEQQLVAPCRPPRMWSHGVGAYLILSVSAHRRPETHCSASINAQAAVPVAPGSDSLHVQSASVFFTLLSGARTPGRQVASVGKPCLATCKFPAVALAIADTCQQGYY